MLNVDKSALWAHEVRNLIKKTAAWQPLAAATWGKCLRVAASGCKWLLEQVAAKWLPSSCKWLQVAVEQVTIRLTSGNFPLYWYWA